MVYLALFTKGGFSKSESNDKQLHWAQLDPRGKTVSKHFSLSFLKIKNLCEEGGFAKSKAFSLIH